MRRASPYLVLGLLLAACFSLATTIQPRTRSWSDRAKSGNVLKLLLGDGRRMFANHFFVQADVSFHGGYYPSIFDQSAKAKESPMVTGHDDHDGHDEEEHEKEMNFLGQPRDWIEKFGRNFRVTEHKHLERGQEREMLPWLKLSAEMDPQRVETYTVAAYWLRGLGKQKEAEEFLREGLRNNPNSCEILFELGRLYSQNGHDLDRARNVWELALRKWQQQESGKPEPNLMLRDQIAVNLGRLQEQSGNLARAVELLEMVKANSPSAGALQKQVDELRARIATPAITPRPTAN